MMERELKFIKYESMDGWFEIREDGSYTIDGDRVEVSAEQSCYSRTVYARDWHDLYITVGFIPKALHDPIEGSAPCREWWVRRDGVVIEGTASPIANYIYGTTGDIDASATLSGYGWVNIKDDALWCRHQKKLGKYTNVTPPQYDSIEVLLNNCRIFPETVLDWEGEYA